MEVLKSYSSVEEYIKDVNQSKIDEVYKEAVSAAVDKETLEDMINEAITEVSDAEAELFILEDLFISGKVTKNELANARRRYTKAKNTLKDLFREEDKNG